MYGQMFVDYIVVAAAVVWMLKVLYCKQASKEIYAKLKHQIHFLLVGIKQGLFIIKEHCKQMYKYEPSLPLVAVP